MKDRAHSSVQHAEVVLNGNDRETIEACQRGDADAFAALLEANKDKAIAIQSEEVYERYMKYLRGCQHYFADEMLDVSLVTYLKPGAAA